MQIISQFPRNCLSSSTFSSSTSSSTCYWKVLVTLMVVATMTVNTRWFMTLEVTVLLCFVSVLLCFESKCYVLSLNVVFVCHLNQNKSASRLILSASTQNQFLNSYWEVNALLLKTRLTSTFQALNQPPRSASYRKTVDCSVVWVKLLILSEFVHVVTSLEARQLSVRSAYRGP